MNAEFIEGWKDGVRTSCKLLAADQIEHLFLTHKFPLIVITVIVEAAKKKLQSNELIVDKDSGETYHKSGYTRGVWFVLDRLEENEISFVSDEAAAQVRKFVSDLA